MQQDYQLENQVQTNKYLETMMKLEQEGFFDKDDIRYNFYSNNDFYTERNTQIE